MDMPDLDLAALVGRPIELPDGFVTVDVAPVGGITLTVQPLGQPSVTVTLGLTEAASMSAAIGAIVLGSLGIDPEAAAGAGLMVADLVMGDREDDQ